MSKRTITVGAERLKRLRIGVRDDGTVEGHDVETHLASVYGLAFPSQYPFAFDRKNQFIAFAIDNGETDLEVRLPFELIEKLNQQIKLLQRSH